MKKRGFTLIEIIISISLIAIIGTISVVSIVSLRKAKVENLLESNSKVLNNALEVYLEKHPEVTNNVNNNFKGAVVTLQVLKDEGLIDIKGLSDRDYKKNYYFLSNSVLADGNKVDESKCENNILSLQTVTSWDLNNLDPEQIIYICPTSGSGNTTTSLVNVKNYIAKGENPNNYVEFKVNSDISDTWTKWPSQNTNLWRIISINEGKIKLVYSQPIETNNMYNYQTGIEIARCRDDDWSSNYRAHNPESNEQGYCALKVYCYGDISPSDIQPEDGYHSGLRYSHYLKYSSQNIWTSSEIMSEYSGNDFTNSPNACYKLKKAPLIENIDSNYKKMIIENDYMFNKETKDTVRLNLGFITMDDYSNSIYNGKTYLDSNAYVSDFEKYYNASQIQKFDKGLKSWYSGCGFRPGVELDQYCQKCGPGKCDARFRFYKIEGIEYYPVITLDEKVKISIDNNCIGDVYGSLSCPYKLKCDNCDNDPTVIN